MYSYWDYGLGKVSSFMSGVNTPWSKNFFESTEGRKFFASMIKTNYPKQIIKFNHDKNKLHPTQKPVALLEYLIKTYTNENDLVLDNTMGSGSTGVACVNLNRRFIGIEKEEKYFEIAKRRIEEANNQT